MTDQQDAAPAAERHSSHLIRVLSSMRFATSFAFGVGATVRILHMDSLGLTVESIGLIMACYSVVIAVSEIPSGAIADVWGRRRTKLLSSWIMAGAYLLLGAAQDVPTVLASAFFLGIGRALFSGAADSWFVDEIGDAKSPVVLAGLARAEAAHNVGNALGALTGALLPLLWLDAIDERSVFAPIFVLGAGVLVVDLWITWRYMKETRTPDRFSIRGVWRTTFSGIANTIDSPPPRWTALAAFAVGGSVACIELLVPLTLSDSLGVDRALVFIGPLVAGAWLVSGATALLTERVEKISGSVHRGAGLLAFALVITLAPAGLGEWYFAVAAYFGVNLVLGPMIPLLSTALHQHVRSENRSAAASTLGFTFVLGAAAASLLIGALDATGVVAVSAFAMTAAVGLTLLPSSRSTAD